MICGGRPWRRSAIAPPCSTSTAWSDSSCGTSDGECCAGDGVAVPDLIEDSAVALLAERLKTPLQIEQHLALAFEEAFRIGERPVNVQVIESVMSRHMDDLEPRLTRHGYTVRALAEQFSVKPAEVRQLRRGELNATRAQELAQRMLAAGLPI
jgi:hypothetical protein